MTGSGTGNQWIEEGRESEGEASARPHGDQEHAAGSGKTRSTRACGQEGRGVLNAGQPQCPVGKCLQREDNAEKTLE